MCCRPPQTSSRPPFTRPARAHRAFTLVEMMVVLVLIGLLAGLVTINARTYLVKGRQNAAKAEIATIEQALATFYGEYGRYPTAQEGIDCLAQPGERLPNPPLTKVPIDPWGHPYQYLCPGRASQAYEVVSYGADGKEGGDGADADLTSADLGPSKVSSTGTTP